MSDLGTFAAQFADWRKVLASIPTIEARTTVFANLAEDAAKYVANGLDKRAAVDELQEIATANGLVETPGGVDEVQTIISDAFARAQYDPEVLWPDEKKPARNNGGNGHRPPQRPLPPIMAKQAFLLAYGKPADFLIDDILQKGFIYALTGQTGHAKTAVALLVARLVGSIDPNAMLGARKVSKGRVIYFVGENPDDVSIRLKGSDAMRTDKPSEDRIWFIPGTFEIERMLSVIEADTKKNGDVSLIVVDTSAAYFLGNEELNNVQMGAYARVLRRLTTLPGRPCVLVLCHPIKHVIEPSQLLPRGGGAYLAEMDGNLTLWRTTDETVELYYTKLRGPSFQPIQFQLKTIKTPALLDVRGRMMTTVEAVAISRQEEEAVAKRETSDEDHVLAAMLNETANDGGSFARWATMSKWVDGAGEPHKKKVERIIKKLAGQKPKLVMQVRDKWFLTEEGKEEARKAALSFERVRLAESQGSMNFGTL